MNRLSGTSKTPFRQNGGSFAPTFAFKNLKRHPVFLRFLTQNLWQNSSPSERKSVFRGPRLFSRLSVRHCRGGPVALPKRNGFEYLPIFTYIHMISTPHPLEMLWIAGGAMPLPYRGRACIIPLNNHLSWHSGHFGHGAGEGIAGGDAGGTGTTEQAAAEVGFAGWGV